MKTMVYPKLFVGNQQDYENGTFTDDYSFVLAAKEPFHRATLQYTGRAADKTDPEYLFARRDNKLILNLVDAPKPEFFDKRIIDTALEFIDEQLNAGRNVMIVCNQGESRSPSIAMLYIATKCLSEVGGVKFVDYEAVFMNTYPSYNPGAGIRAFMKQHWNEYVK